MTDEPFRGQYLFGPDHGGFRLPDDFERIPVAAGRALYRHRDLPASVQVEEGRSAAIVGNVFDGENPSWSAAQILSDVVRSGIARLPARTGRLAGRWALFVLDGAREVAIHDACGTLPIVWCRRGEEVLAASSAKLIHRALPDLEPNRLLSRAGFPELQLDPRYASGLPYPVSATEFEPVRVMLPNRLLDLGSGSEERIHPLERQPERPAEEVAPQVARMLTGIVHSMANRAPLALGVTSGFDSRVLLGAVSRVSGLARQAEFFTFQDLHGTHPGHTDLVNGRKLVEQIGGRYEEIAVDAASDTGRARCRASESMIAPRFESWAECCLSAPFSGRLTLSGWCSEVARCYVRWEGSRHADARDVRNCSSLGRAPALQPLFEEWTCEAVQASRRSGIHLLDLFYWELRCGRWIGSNLNVLNAASDWVGVYSCRDLLDAMLSVRAEDRSGRDQALYRRIISELNPDLMSIEINPPSRYRLEKEARARAKARVVRAARAIGVHGALRRLLRH